MSNRFHHTAVHCRLDDGSLITTIHRPMVHASALVVASPWGSRDDPPGHRGLAHFFEHMLFRGDAERPSPHALSAAFADLGAEINGATSRNDTQFHLTCPAERMGEAAQLFGAMLAWPALVDIGAERRVVFDEQAREAGPHGETTDPIELGLGALFGDDPLGAPVLGTEACVRRITRADLRGHARLVLATPVVQVTIAGPQEPGQLLVSALSVLSRLPGGSTLPRRHPPGGSPPGCRVHVGPTTDSRAIVALAFPGLPALDPRYPALDLAVGALAGHPTSVLDELLRDKLGLVYEVECAAHGGSDGGGRPRQGHGGRPGDARGSGRRGPRRTRRAAPRVPAPRRARGSRRDRRQARRAIEKDVAMYAAAFGA
jgi:predicted Zn-dependent peptidase